MAIIITTTLATVRTAGIGQDIKNELLGTGDNAQKSYDTANGNIIASSYTLKYAAASGNDTNSFTSLTETTHYTIDKEGGSILLTASGVTALGTNKLYIDYTHSPKASDTVVEHMIERAEADINLITGNNWSTTASFTETFDGRDEERYPSTDHPFVDTDYENQDVIQLQRKSVQTITSVKFYTRNRQSSRTLDSTEYTFNENGRLVFANVDLPVGKSTIDVTYTAGYTSVPTYVKELVELSAGIMLFTNITGGSYDDATSFTLGRKSVSIGEVYVNVRDAVKQMRDRYNELLQRIGPQVYVGG